MQTRNLSTSRRIAIAGLILGALGIVILGVAGLDMPVVPPGLVLLLAAAVALVSGRGRWAAVLATVVGVAEIGGFFASGSYVGLLESGSPGLIAGTWIRLLGITTAAVSGLVASFEHNRPEQEARRTADAR